MFKCQSHDTTESWVFHTQSKPLGDGWKKITTYVSLLNRRQIKKNNTTIVYIIIPHVSFL